MTTLTRPRTLEEMRARLPLLRTEESTRRGLSLEVKPSDVFISPYGKCGTTWMQQIVHGLRTGGSMAFDEITEVVPWLEMAHDLGIDPSGPQIAHPRAFKSHLRWEEIPKGGRYIVVLRDPMDAMFSLYRFFDGWQFEAGAIGIEAFADFYLERDLDRSYWGHAISWWRQHDHPDVLLLSYEGMKADLPDTVDRVADFIDGEYDPERRAIATRQAEFSFMKAHAQQFDDHLLRDRRDAACGLPPGGTSDKVARGESGGGVKTISEEIRARFDVRWRETLGAEFGLASYAELLAALRDRAIDDD